MRWILKKTLSLVIRHSQLRRFWRLRLEGERIPAILVEYSSILSQSTKIPHTYSCSSLLRSEFILCEAHTMYPYSIFVVNHSRRHYLQFHHPLMRMFSLLQPFKRRHLKSSTHCHSPTSISWSRSSARLGYRVLRCARL